MNQNQFSNWIWTLHILSDTEPSQHETHELESVQEAVTGTQQADIEMQQVEGNTVSQESITSVPQLPENPDNSQGTSFSTLQHLQHMAALCRQLDTVHHYYFTSAHYLNMQKITESKLYQEKLKVDIQLSKLEKQRLQSVVHQSQLQE